MELEMDNAHNWLSNFLKFTPGSNVKTAKTENFWGKREKSPFYGQFLGDKKNSIKISPFSPS